MLLDDSRLVFEFLSSPSLCLRTGAIGVLASIGQLVDYSLKLTGVVNEVNGRVKYAPERAIYHAAQIRQLVITAQLIERRTELQQPFIVVHVRYMLLEVQNLQKLLEWSIHDFTEGSCRRIWKAVIGAEDQRISALTG